MQLKFGYSRILKICKNVSWSCKYQESNYSRDQCFLLMDNKANLFLQKWFLQSFYELRWYETHLCCDVLFIDVNNKTKLTYWNNIMKTFILPKLSICNQKFLTLNLCNINDQKLKENTKYIVNKTANNVSYGQDIPRHNANRLPGSVSVH